jgi:TetR/AcrR family transcriptional regulator, transcriptional repressor for nem operon
LLFVQNLGNYYVENLQQQKINEGTEVPSFNYISLIFDAIKLFPDFQERLRVSKQVQINAWKEIIHVARNKGEIKSPMNDEQIASMFINSSGGVEMHGVFDGSSNNIGKTLLNLWNSFYEGLKA